jgi:hypothetical protein
MPERANARGSKSGGGRSGRTHTTISHRPEFASINRLEPGTPDNAIAEAVQRISGIQNADRASRILRTSTIDRPASKDAVAPLRRLTKEQSLAEPQSPQRETAEGLGEDPTVKRKTAVDPTTGSQFIGGVVMAVTGFQIIKPDAFVKSIISGGFVKASRSRLAKTEERGVLMCTPQ